MSARARSLAIAMAAVAVAVPVTVAPAAAKTCKPFSVSAGGEKKLTNLSARVSARWHWHRKVKGAHGFAWSTYALAAGESYACSRHGIRWRCTAHARPCKL